MRKCGWRLLVFGISLVLCACHAGKQSSQALPPTGVRAEDVVGKWWLVRAGGKSPAEAFINSMELDFAADGTWKNKIEWQGPLAGMTMAGGGTWSLADGVVSFTNGADKGQSRVSLSAGRLALDPDFTLRKNDATKTPLAVEYEAAGIHKEPVTLQGNAGEVNCVAFSPDGKTLASGSRGRTIKAMGRGDGQGTGHPQRTQGRGGVSWRSARTARRWPRGAADETIKLWDVGDGQETGHSQGRHGLGDLPWRSVRTARRWPRGVRDAIKLWDVATGKEQATLKGHEHVVWSVAYSPDGKTLASASWDGTIKLWDVATGKATGNLQGTAQVGVTPWLSVRTARRWPSRMTAGSSCGTWRRARNGPLSRDTRENAGRWLSVRTARRWPRERGRDDQAVGRGDGKREGHPSVDPRARCGLWLSARTARRWPRGAWTGRSSCWTFL